MAFSLEDVLDELRTLVRTSFSLTTPPANKFNLLTSVQAAGFNFVEAVKDGTIVLPCAIIHAGNFGKQSEFGLANINGKRFPVNVFYIRARGASGNQSDLADPMCAFVAGMDAPTASFTHFQVIEEGEVQANIDCPVNEALFADENVDVLASRGYWLPGWLVNIG